MSPAPFKVDSEDLQGGVRALTVQGELDMNTTPELEQQLDKLPAEGDAPILLDLSDCEFIDSTGIALIVRAWQRLDRNGKGEGKGRFVLCCVNDQVHRLLTITGLDASIAIHEQRDAALAELKAEAA